MNDCLVHVTTPAQAEAMRVIRNTCRQWMTNNQDEITSEQQLTWFESIRKAQTVLPFLYQPRAQDPMGYGLIRKLDGKWWVSGGLLPMHRRKGYGYLLFGELADYVNAAKQTCWLTVFESNIAATKTYHALGFKDVSTAPSTAERSAIITMQRSA